MKTMIPGMFISEKSNIFNMDNVKARIIEQNKIRNNGEIHTYFYFAE
jgi:hypothetical protein